MDYLRALLDVQNMRHTATDSWLAKDLVDLHKPSLWICVASCLFNPIFWNTVAQTEYRYHWLTKVAGGPYRGCYVLALTIFGLGIFRDHLFAEALKDQPRSLWLDNQFIRAYAVALAGCGGLFVVTSMWALGVTGTYLGDYFGILMDHMVTDFPFNITTSPMYDGSSMLFLAVALWNCSPVGVIISGLVYLEYRIALQYEDSFTATIYAKRDEQRKKQNPAKAITPANREAKKEL